MRYFLILGFIGISAFGQISYSVTKKTTLGAAAEVITVQQPTSGAKTVTFNCNGCGIYFDSSVAVDITIERNGTAAANTPLAPLQVNPQVGIGPTTKAFSGSDVGIGTVIGRASCAGACNLVFGVSNVSFSGNDNTQNLTLRTSSITGTVNVVFVYQER